MAAARAPIRGERGFAADQRARGGDPRLTAARKARERPQSDSGSASEPVAPETAPEPTTRRRRGLRDRGRAYNQATGRLGATSATPSMVAGVPRVTVEDGASLVLGVLAWVLTMNYLRGGMPAVKAWLRAKFLNQTSGGAP